MSLGGIFREGFPEKPSSNLLIRDMNNEQNLAKQLQEGFRMEAMGAH